MTAGAEESTHYGDAKWDGKPYDALIFEGGGTKGMVYSGALTRLDKAGLVKNVKCFSGSSAGAQTAVLAAVGYTGEEVEKIMSEAPWDKLLDWPKNIWPFQKLPEIFQTLYRLKKYKGVCRGEFLLQYLDGLIATKTGKTGYTFKQLWDDKQVHVRCGVCNLVTRQFELLDYVTHPDMPLAFAARASSSIPFVFYPALHKDAATGKTYGPYVDGGLEGNLPVSAFRGKRTLAFDLMVSQDWKTATEPPKKFIDFATTIVDMLMNSAQAMGGYVESNDQKSLMTHVVKIDCGTSGMLNTSMSEEEVKSMVKRGWTAVDRFIDPPKDAALRI